jgi:hypothetical protein
MVCNLFMLNAAVTANSLCQLYNAVPWIPSMSLAQIAPALFNPLLVLQSGSECVLGLGIIATKNELGEICEPMRWRTKKQHYQRDAVFRSDVKAARCGRAQAACPQRQRESQGCAASGAAAARSPGTIFRHHDCEWPGLCMPRFRLHCVNQRPDRTQECRPNPSIGKPKN